MLLKILPTFPRIGYRLQKLAVSPYLVQGLTGSKRIKCNRQARWSRLSLGFHVLFCRTVGFRDFSFARRGRLFAGRHLGWLTTWQLIRLSRDINLDFYLITQS